jgi:hypothetical protein
MFQGNSVCQKYKYKILKHVYLHYLKMVIKFSVLRIQVKYSRMASFQVTVSVLKNTRVLLLRIAGFSIASESRVPVSSIVPIPLIATDNLAF